MPGHQHRPGSLKQSNKKNKRSKASKRSLALAAGGKVASRKSAVWQRQVQQSKTDRKNRQQQIRENKRNDLLKRRRRSVDGNVMPPPPRIVGIISLGTSTEIEEKLRDFLAQDADRCVGPDESFGGKNPSLTVKYDVHKKDGVLTLLTCGTAFANNYPDNQGDSAIFAALDLARIADVLLFVVDANGPRNEDSSDPILDMQIGSTDDDHNNDKSAAHHPSWDHLIGDRGDRILTCLRAQGFPSIITVLAQTENDNPYEEHMTMPSVKSLRRASIKRRLDLKKYLGRFALTEFGSDNDKVVEVDLSSSLSSSEKILDVDKNEGDYNGNHPDLSMDPEEIVQNEVLTMTSTHAARASPATLIRTLCNMTCSPSKWIANSMRSYLVSDHYSYDSTTRELSIRGYLRGMAPFDINTSLVHVPCLGTFAPKAITRQDAPIKQQQQWRKLKDNLDMDVLTSTEDTLVPDPEHKPSLNMFAEPDALAGEQNLIGFDEEEEEREDELGASEGQEEGFERPAGWSDYQSAWLDAVDGDDFNGEMDRGELAQELNKKKSDSSEAANEMDLNEANDVSPEERQRLLEMRKKEQRENEDFPDEVQVGEDVKASERFARYRSLKSFKKASWDPKESLPDSYATIYHFANFKATQRMVMNDKKEVQRAADSARGNFFGKSPVDGQDTAMEGDSEDEEFDPLEGCVPSGSYVSLTLGDVSEDAMRSVSPGSLLTAVSLLEHENKVSVLHMGLSQSPKMSPSDGVPIKSKDRLTFRCGWRTWQARPIFSQNNLNCDKHKYERFMPTGGAYFVASLFGPVSYAPCPVLVFKDDGGGAGGETGRKELVAAGSVMSADADRIVIKRIILTGYPVRVHKRHATVKYMFYNPDDVKWFKPAELCTKHGLRGNILESVGEHGTMKCLFNAPIKQHDTVCLPLYKRVYPKYVGCDDGKKSDEKFLSVK